MCVTAGIESASTAGQEIENIASESPRSHGVEAAGTHDCWALWEFIEMGSTHVLLSDTIFTNVDTSRMQKLVRRLREKDFGQTMNYIQA